MVVLAAEPSGLCGKILARLDQGECATGKLLSGTLPCPTQLGSRHQLGLLPLLLAWGMDTQHLDRAFLIPTLGAQSIYSAQLTLNKTLSRDILLSSPLP